MSYYQNGDEQVSCRIKINTQNMTNPTIVSPVKMESVSKNIISGLEMMVKSGLEKIFIKFLHE